MKKEMIVAGVEIEKMDEEKYDITKSIENIINIMNKEESIHNVETYVETINNEKLYLEDFKNYKEGTISQEKRDMIEKYLKIKELSTIREFNSRGFAEFDILSLIVPTINERIRSVNIRSVKHILKGLFLKDTITYKDNAYRLPAKYSEAEKEILDFYGIEEKEKLTPKRILENEPMLKEALILHIIKLAEKVYKQKNGQSITNNHNQYLPLISANHDKDQLLKIAESDNKIRDATEYLERKLELKKKEQVFNLEIMKLFVEYIVNIFQLDSDVGLHNNFVSMTLGDSNFFYKENTIAITLALDFMMKMFEIYTEGRTWKKITQSEIRKNYDKSYGEKGLRYIKRIEKRENKAIKMYYEIRQKAKRENKILNEEYLKKYREKETQDGTEERMIVDVLIKLYGKYAETPTAVIIRNANGKIINKPTEEDILYIKLYTTVRSQQELDAINELKGLDLLKFQMSGAIIRIYWGIQNGKIEDKFIQKMMGNMEKLLENTGVTKIEIVEALVNYANLEKYMWKWKRTINY
ncbi:MAG: hypothetical protein ACTSWZ_05515 [Candidatus Heimdallarchaeaceae archaeon]